MRSLLYDLAQFPLHKVIWKPERILMVHLGSTLKAEDLGSLVRYVLTILVFKFLFL